MQGHQARGPNLRKYVNLGPRQVLYSVLLDDYAGWRLEQNVCTSRLIGAAEW
jgi:hypothetical protein